MALDWVSISLLGASGIVGGLLAGLFGIGGGLVIVPTLYFFLINLSVTPELAMSMAIQTSLISIIPTSVSSARAHHYLGNVDWSIVRRWCPATVFGVVIGALLVASIRSKGFTIGFGVLLLSIALYKSIYPENRSREKAMSALWLQRVCAAIIGLISACAGVGGGATSVPAMLFMGVPIHRAVGTSAALGFAIAVPASLMIFLASDNQATGIEGSFRLVYLPALVILAPLTVLCAPFGASIGKRMSAKTLSRLFAVALCVVGLKMIISAV